MGNSRKRKTRRGRIGKVSYFVHHGAWYVYYREHGVPIRRRVGEDQQAAKRAAAQINAQLATAAPTLFAFEPIEIPELQQSFLDHHEHVLRSSLATITRYRTATQHLVNFSQQGQRRLLAHELDFDTFVRYLRSLRVGANGHVNTRRRPLRDKGVRYILETCRSMYGYAARKRHLPPYGDNPFEGIGRKRFRIEDAKRIFVFDRQTELKFFQEADPWAFPVFLTLAKTGLRVGEVVHLLVEDVDLDGGWLQIRNKVELGWRIKTGQDRSIPLVDELALVLRRVIGTRQVGPVFRRARFAPESSIVAAADFDELAAEVQQRAEAAESQSAEPLTREQVAAISRRVWREAGGLRNNLVRLAYVKIMQALNRPQDTCPKSWRHTFATLLQEANVDPLIRQIVLGHSPSTYGVGALGMTTRYSHHRPVTIKSEIVRALRLWPEVLDVARHWSQGGVP